MELNRNRREHTDRTMDVAKLFADLESNNMTLVDDAKKRFSELFGNSK